MNTNQPHDYALTRRVGPWASAHTHIRWTVGDQRPLAQPGSLEHFLTERYNLFTKRRGRIMFGRIHHNPWPLHDATAEVVGDTLLQAAGLNINTPPDSTLASPTIDVLGYPLQHAHDRAHQ